MTMRLNKTRSRSCFVWKHGEGILGLDLPCDIVTDSVFCRNTMAKSQCVGSAPSPSVVVW